MKGYNYLYRCIIVNKCVRVRQRKLIFCDECVFMCVCACACACVKEKSVKGLPSWPRS